MSIRRRAQPAAPQLLAAPPLPPDPMVQRYGLYAEDGKIGFIRLVGRYRTVPQKQRYTYFTDTRELWRVYMRNGQKLRHIPSWQSPLIFVRSNDLAPILPTHLRVDQGL